jgi:protein involved in polysaccharide export with SLBB domain
LGDLDRVLTLRIGRVFKEFEVSSTISKIRNIQVYVVGHANQPGTHWISSNSTLLSAIFEVGGVSINGSLRSIQVIRTGKILETEVDLYEFIRKGIIANDIKLLPGDTILFNKAGDQVAVTGAVDEEAIYEIKKNNSKIIDLLQSLDEKLTIALINKLIIERVNKDGLLGNRTIDEIDLNTSEGRLFELKDGDILSLLPVTEQFINAVTLKGNVAYPMRYKFRDGMKISDLIPNEEALIQADYFYKKNAENNLMPESKIFSNQSNMEKNELKRIELNQINWEYAYIERFDKKNLKINIIGFNLSKAIKDHDQENNLHLMPGDTINILSNNEIVIPKKNTNIIVKISGEVNAPGYYQVTKSDDLNTLIKKAGGLTSDAYLYGTVFIRESAKSQQQANLKKLISRLEYETNSKSQTFLQNTTGQETLIAAQAQINYQKDFLNKIRNITPTGRMNLEIKYGAESVPKVQLENKDEILIPPIPSNVFVFGSTYSEMSFEYKNGQKARYYMDRSGLLSDADVDNILILRSDGSIDSSSSKNYFFSTNITNLNIYPGDSIFIPDAFDKRTNYTKFIQGAKDWTQILFQFGIGAAAFKVLKD